MRSYSWKVRLTRVSLGCPLPLIPVVPTPFKLVVKVRMLTPQQQRSHRSVIPVDRIDPCTVAVLPHNDGVHFYMIRDKGTDRTTTI